MQNTASHQHQYQCANWAGLLREESVVIEELITPMLKQSLPPAEIAIAGLIVDLPDTLNLFIGNSLFVRLVDMVTKIDGREVFTNRGASGIDGNIATVAGVQAATQQPMMVFIGDTTLLYDLNSLALLSEHLPLVIVVINNDGGAIFNLLPVPPEKKRRLYQMPHGLEFEQSAKQFNLKYTNQQTISEYQASIRNHFEQGEGAMIIEITVSPDESSNQLKSITELIHAR